MAGEHREQPIPESQGEMVSEKEVISSSENMREVQCEGTPNMSLGFGDKVCIVAFSESSLSAIRGGNCPVRFTHINWRCQRIAGAHPFSLGC